MSKTPFDLAVKCRKMAKYVSLDIKILDVFECIKSVKSQLLNDTSSLTQETYESLVFGMMMYLSRTPEFHHHLETWDPERVFPTSASKNVFNNQAGTWYVCFHVADTLANLMGEYENSMISQGYTSITQPGLYHVELNNPVESHEMVWLITHHSITIVQGYGGYYSHPLISTFDRAKFNTIVEKLHRGVKRDFYSGTLGLPTKLVNSVYTPDRVIQLDGPLRFRRIHV